jgi:secreted PhoX family phosphatase
MGRFRKEAAVADNSVGIVYQTEDAENDSGFYRFLPNDPADLMSGGVLQMLAVSGSPNYDTRSNQQLGTELRVEWVTIDNPDPETVSSASSCFAQGYAKGGARFKRLEGVFRGDAGAIYFVSTNGGNAHRGQLWQYIPSVGSGGTLQLVYESPGSSVLDSPDNICVTPNGGILICEDDASGDGDTHRLAYGIPNVNRLIVLGQDGEPSVFAVNVYNNSEFAGACFSPDGETLFVNVFGDGTANSAMTCAIWGPWHNGPL